MTDHCKKKHQGRPKGYKKRAQASQSPYFADHKVAKTG